MKVVIGGKIKGKARPRFFNGRAVTPKDTVSYENWVKICYQEQCNKKLEGPVKATINIYHQIPKSYTKKRVQAIKIGLEKPLKKPDIDNIVKIILDALNGVAYQDDTQVVNLMANKHYTEEFEKVEIELEEIKL